MDNQSHIFIIAIHRPQNPPLNVILEVERGEITVKQIEDDIHVIRNDITIRFLNYSSLRKWNDQDIEYYAADSLDQLIEWLRVRLNEPPKT